MILHLKRKEQDEKGTFGELYIDSTLLCHTAERPWKNNEHDISCIPSGTYHCVSHDSPKFHNVWEVQNVPDRAEILIHNGNFPLKDTHGCILVGESVAEINGVKAVTNSVETLNKLRIALPCCFDLEITVV